MFDAMQGFLKLVSDMKTPDMERKKVSVLPFSVESCLFLFHFSAAFYCIGELMGALGGNVMSLMAETVVQCLRNYRSSSNVRSFHQRVYQHLI